MSVGQMDQTAFDRAQFDANYPPGIEAHFWNNARNRIILRELHAVRANRRLNRVLEIGCGRGVVLAYMRRHGIECHGIDLSPIPPPADLTSYMQTGDCFDLSSSEREAVDCLLLLDVIEHLPEPVTFLSRLADAFPNAHSIILTVPARPELWSNYDVYYKHFRRYTLASLTAEVTAAGFQVRRAGYMFKALYPVMFILSKFFGQRETTVAAPRGSPMHRLLSTCFVTEYLLAPRWLWGTSALATISPAADLKAG
jgi:SAM-dependent methyltransferase